MLDFLRSIDKVLASLEHVIAVLVLVATVAATIVALWAAHIAREVQLTRVRVSCRWLVHSTDERLARHENRNLSRDREILVATIANLGLREVEVGYYAFQVGLLFSPERLALRPITKFETGLRIAPGSDKSIELLDEKGIREIYSTIKVSVLPNFRRYWLKIYLVLPTGNKISVKMDRATRRQFKRIMLESPTA